MKSFKYLTFQALFSVLAVSIIIPIFSGVSFAKFYCPLGYSYNTKIQLCVGKNSLKGYNALPVTKINVFKGKNHIYICPDKYTYSKKIQLCKGEGSLKGSTAQPTVKTVKAVIALKTSKKAVKK
ncbi:MAG: hypothetical protein M1276_02190 [Deltaproteobacteria bacterium]|jgi:hypothetical protein|nr:hypothetical protein [Deltaproteobacteria bacterium]